MFAAPAETFEIDGSNTDYIHEFMQEINNHIMTSIYISIFNNSAEQKITLREQQFQDKCDRLLKTLKPSDLGISEEIMNEHNMPMWMRAVRELQKFIYRTTPSKKMRYLMQCFMMVNNNFTLFSSGKDEAATTDDLLTIMPYIILQARIPFLLRHLKFIEIFHSHLLL
jgi:hypothetical protein